MEEVENFRQRLFAHHRLQESRELTRARTVQLGQDGLALRATDVGLRAAHSVQATMRTAQVLQHSYHAIHEKIVSLAPLALIVPAFLMIHSGRRVLFLSGFRFIVDSDAGACGETMKTIAPMHRLLSSRSLDNNFK